jgi:hypothetical protein
MCNKQELLSIPQIQLKYKIDYIAALRIYELEKEILKLKLKLKIYKKNL